MAEPFKNLLSPEVVSRMGQHLHRVHPPFRRAEFEAAVLPGLVPLELKARVGHVARGLRPFLPAAFPEASAVLVQALGPEVGTEGFEQEHDQGIRGMVVWALTRFVSEFGLAHFEASMAALAAMTRRLTAEFDIRPFLEHHPEATWAQIHRWAESDNVHLRRLASEGTRPRLPWGTRVAALTADPHRGLAVLEKLKDDPELYVRRSVANHLNDVSKDHPALALETGQRWLAGASEARAWIVRHALRSALKAADPQALALFEYPPVEVEVRQFTVAPAVAFTGALPYTLELAGVGPVLIDEVVHFMKARGERRPKVFRIADRVLEAGKPARYDRFIDFKPITTRTHYPGLHRLEIRVNGAVVAGQDFTLEAP